MSAFRYLSVQEVCPAEQTSALVLAMVVCAALLVAVGGVGWAVRDRAARNELAEYEHAERQARVWREVELILEEVGHFEQQKKWQDALAAASRAEAALSVGETPEHLQAEVRETVAELQMIEHLEEIRLAASEIKEQKFNHVGTSRRYSTAFQQYGVNVAALPADEAAVWFQKKGRVLSALIVALDHWAACSAEAKDEPVPRPCSSWPRRWTWTPGATVCVRPW